MQDRRAVLEAAQPTKRFSDRVDHYQAHRPTYPSALVSDVFLDDNVVGLQPGVHVVADVGSGTGISSRLLLEKGVSVYGVEPNEQMRQAGEIFLKEYLDAGRFVSVAAGAEDTTLPDRSVDLIMAGQAFHWFKTEEAKKEWKRILKPLRESRLKANVVLFWNKRCTGDRFSDAYEALLARHCVDYGKVHHQNVIDQLEEFNRFFAWFQQRTFAHHQELDLEGLIGRTRSISYCPTEQEPAYEPLMAGVKELFGACASPTTGTLTMSYDTKVFFGALN